MDKFLENNPATPNFLTAELEKMIDNFVGQLKQQLVQSWTNPQNQRGVLDRMKNWWSNMWHGRYNQNNPYFWQNKLGDDLGQKTEAVIPLKHYGILSEYATILEESLPAGTERLNIIRVIDGWAIQFKKAIMDLVGQQPAPEALPSETPPTASISPDMEKPNDNSWKTDSLERLEKLKDKISSVRYEETKNKIENNDKDFVDRFLNYMEKHHATEPPVPRTAPMRLPTDLPTPPKSTGPTTNKKWDELNPHEQLEWDKHGGGNAGDATVLAKKNGIQTLPWILRIGDPRLKIIQNLYGRALYDRLVRQKRIESVTNPIQSEEDLQKAVAVAEKLRNDEKTKASEKNRATAARTRLKSDITNRLEPESPKIDPVAPKEPELNRVAPKITPPEEKPTEEKPRTAPMKTSEDQEPVGRQKLEELTGRLEALQGAIDDSLYKRLKKRLDELQTVKQAKNLEKRIEDAETEEDYSVHDGSRGGLSHFEGTRTERTQTIIENFRSLARR